MKLTQLPEFFANYSSAIDELDTLVRDSQKILAQLDQCVDSGGGGEQKKEKKKSIF